jgi:hypothetical protein
MADDSTWGNFGSFINPVLGAILSGQGLFGKPSGSYSQENPQDQALRQNMVRNAMTQYDNMVSKPGGMIPDAYRKMLQNQSEEQIRSSRPGAAQSGALEDLISRSKNQINLDLVKQELDQADKQRTYMAQLMGMGRPQQHLPREAGAVEAVGGNMFGQGMADIFGLNQGKQRSPVQGTNPTGGMTAGQTSVPNYNIPYNAGQQSGMGYNT